MSRRGYGHMNIRSKQCKIPISTFLLAFACASISVFQGVQALGLDWNALPARLGLGDVRQQQELFKWQVTSRIGSQPRRRTIPSKRNFLLPLYRDPNGSKESDVVVSWSSVPSPQMNAPSQHQFTNENLLKCNEQRYDLNLLLIDHYDSFTYNLADLLAQLCVRPPLVLACDSADSWLQLQERYNLSSINSRLDGIILSPGPGSPLDDAARLSRDLVRNLPNMPILGVCLGHQILGHVYGATISLAPQPVHGQVRSMNLIMDYAKQDPLFGFMQSQASEHQQEKTATALPDDPPVNGAAIVHFDVTRYHSLQVCLDGASKDGTQALIPTAYCSDDGVLMAMRHSQHPHWGLQFHPESVGTPRGQEIIRSFCQICHSNKYQEPLKGQKSALLQIDNGHKLDFLLSNEKATTNGVSASFGQLNSPVNGIKIIADGNLENVPSRGTKNGTPKGLPSACRHNVYIHAVHQSQWRPIDVMTMFLRDEDYAFWLDEARASCQGQDTPAISILGAPSHTEMGSRVEYWGFEKPRNQQGLFLWNPAKGTMERSDKYHDILSYLGDAHKITSEDALVVDFVSGLSQPNVKITRETEETLKALVPFDYRGGHVGYLGYEVRHDTKRYLEQEEGSALSDSSLSARASYVVDDSCQPKSDPTVPTAAFLWADRSFVYDHQAGAWYLIGVVPRENNVRDTLHWLKDVASILTQSPGENRMLKAQLERGNQKKKRATSSAANMGVPTFHPNRSQESYNKNFHECIKCLTQGDSYELCLTNQLETAVWVPAMSNPLDLYKVLRQRNPAPFSAYLNWNGWNHGITGGHHQPNDACRSDAPLASLSICCSSPERFVSVKRRAIVGRPFRAAADVSISGSYWLEVEAKPIKGTCARALIPRDDDSKQLHVRRIARELTAPEKCRDFQKDAVMKSDGFASNDLEPSWSPNLVVSDSAIHSLPQECQQYDHKEDKARARSLQTSIKNRAENLMIVDLLRNDLSRVCETGSVHVAKLMDIESYATVHQMVSTIRGILDPRKSSAIDVLKVCFPGGSMTGAPKLRSVELLDEMEERVCRGPYSGCLGYISLNGSMDMNNIIRTAILTPGDDMPNDSDQRQRTQWKIKIGAGGAITALSESKDEYEEMLLKAAAVMQAVQEWYARFESISTGGS